MSPSEECFRLFALMVNDCLGSTESQKNVKMVHVRMSVYLYISVQMGEPFMGFCKEFYAKKSRG